MIQRSEGLVRVSYGSHGVVQLDGGASVYCSYRRRVGRPYCGDRVLVGFEDSQSAVVERILPRRNEFARADQLHRRHVVAANLDRVLIVLALKPLPSRDLLERYLLAVHSLDIEPVIVLNKVDLGFYDESDPGGQVLYRLPAYAGLGYTLLHTSCKKCPGIHDLEPVLSGKTSILVGQSGVGKSSLVRQLLPDLDIQTGALSRATGKGTHTTTTTILYELPGGGRLIDSPGVWEYGLWSLEPATIMAGFVEFRPFLGACRFNDCLHRSEPGCAVKQAVAERHITDWRYQAYLRVLEQN